MLKKLIKYDFLSVFKIWWIAATASLGVSVFGGLMIRLFANGIEISEAEEGREVLSNAFMVMGGGFGILLTILALSAFSVVTMVLVYVRYYKNFFSDEGYLTFTLPVDRHTLLWAKTFNGLIWEGLLLVSLVVDFLILFSIGGIWNSAVREFIDEMFYALFIVLPQDIGVGWWIVYLIEGLLLLVTSTWAGIALWYMCITIGSSITQKYKVLLSIAIFYAVNLGKGFLTGFISMFGSVPIVWFVSLMTPEAGISVLLFVGALFYAGVACVWHFITLHLLKNKLNLA